MVARQPHRDVVHRGHVLDDVVALDVVPHARHEPEHDTCDPGEVTADRV